MSNHFTWATCQALSDQLLAEGLCALTSQVVARSVQISSEHAGNYLISLNDESLYIGEAGNLAARIRQQFATKSSTFYRNYRKAVSVPTAIDEFRVRCIETKIGRKEIEEFSIVNAACSLNKFQRGKRNVVPTTASVALWNQVQDQFAAILSQGGSAVLGELFLRWSEAKTVARPGVYVVRAPQRKDILYVGESSDVKKRHTCHSGKTYFSALRRHVGTELLGFSLTERNGKARYFTEVQDHAVTQFLCSCTVACFPTNFGRFELEEHLIRNCRPQLNRKGNAKQED